MYNSKDGQNKYTLGQGVFFYKQLVDEVLKNNDELDLDSHDALVGYYPGLKNERLRPFYQYNWTRRVELMRKLITALPKRDTNWRVLDAGCGVGTESIFWSTLRDDLEVTGIDIKTERLNTARDRHKAYEMRLNRPLNVRFLEQDVYRLLHAENFDLVWVMEAISHIDPAEDFLSAVFENLNPQGHLVISDSHILNPVMAWRVYKLRRRGVELRTRITTSMGETISYAQERLFSVAQMSKMLKKTGFRSVHTQLSVFFPPRAAQVPFLFKLGIKYDYLMNRVPLLRNLGGIYTIIADK